MVQYVFTPWRDRRELLLVRQQFYGDSSSTTTPRHGSHGQGRAAASGGGLTAHRHYQQQQKRQSERDADAEADAEADADADVDADGGLNQGNGPAPEGILQRQRLREQQHQAVARVSMWMQRGNCPHMVESTALLMAAVLSDESAAIENAGSSTYAVRAAYSAAFSRFVTGLLDGHQDKLRKQSMYSIAKTIGLPATFVELRHQATHEQLPSLAKLRSAAKKALAWIWDYYWKHLVDEGSATMDPCRQLVMSYLREDDEAAKGKAMKQLRQWDLDRVLRTVAELQETLPGNQVFLKCLKLSNELMAVAAEAEAALPGTDGTDKDLEEDTPAEEESGSGGDPDTEPALESERTSELDTGWSRYSSWKPKPIGIA